MSDNQTGNIYLAYDFVDKVFKLNLSQIPLDTDGNYKLPVALVAMLGDMAQKLVNQGRERGYEGFEGVG